MPVELEVKTLILHFSDISCFSLSGHFYNHHLQRMVVIYLIIEIGKLILVWPSQVVHEQHFPHKLLITLFLGYIKVKNIWSCFISVQLNIVLCTENEVLYYNDRWKSFKMEVFQTGTVGYWI